MVVPDDTATDGLLCAVSASKVVTVVVDKASTFAKLSLSDARVVIDAAKSTEEAWTPKLISDVLPATNE